MTIKVNVAGRSNADKLIAAGDVANLDDGGVLSQEAPDWGDYAQWFLAIDTEADPETRDAYKYPIAGGGAGLRETLTTIQHQAEQDGATDVLDAANALIQKVGAQDHQDRPTVPAWMQRRSGRGYEMRAVGDGKTAEIVLYNVIGSWWDEFSAAQMEAELRELGDIAGITVRINSPGGELFDAIAIYNMLKRHPATVTVYIDGLAASAASIVAMAGDHIVMPKNTQMMIHNGVTIAMGDYRNMESTALRLRKANESAIETYAEKAGVDKTEIAAMMDDETWLTAMEAVSLGLADSLERDTETRTAWDLSCYRNAPHPVEHRKGTGYETRDVSVGAAEIVDGKKIVGYAAKWNEPTEVNGFVEVIQKGAFTRALSEEQDIRGLYNHNPDIVLGRSKAGTLRLVEDDEGLRYEIDPPDTQTARDIMVSIERGDVTGSSFGFSVPSGGAVWDYTAAKPVRTLTDVDLYDVSPVVFPAYETSTTSIRSDITGVEIRRKKLDLLTI